MALSLADHVILTDIYPAREEPIEGITSEKMALEVGDRATYCKDGDVVHTVDLRTHGVIIVMGAGDLEAVKDDLIRGFI